jgi:hypothetical protein
VDPAAIRIGRPLSHPFASGIELLGADPWPPAVNAGQTLPLKLYWRAAQTPSTPPRLTVHLRDASGSAAAGISADVAISATTPGQIVHTITDLHLPPDAPAGSYDLLLSAPAQRENAPVSLGQIVVANRPRQFTMPVTGFPCEVTFGDAVQLLGLDAPSREIRVSAGRPITVTLAWRALNTPARDLVRFLHVLGPDGRPVAQEDRQPCAGACPAPSWLPGEVLTDQARLTLPADLPAGTYPLAVGWYDAETFRRLPVSGGAPGGAEDLALLPVAVVVTR